VIQKYGGTSIGTPERIRTIAQKIAAEHQTGQDTVVVVSAMGKTTDNLISLAQEVSENPPHREMDMLLTVGERISMALLSMALSHLGVEAVSYTGSQCGIITNASHRRARIRRILGDRIRQGLSQRKVVIVAGFQGMSEEKEITTLGRGGSDTSAVALAAALGARRCDIYTDVDGVMSADPRVIQSAKLLKKVTYPVMLELACRGAGVLDPRCVTLANKYDINLWVKNSLKFGEAVGTEIMTEMNHKGTEMERFAAQAVTLREDLAWVEIQWNQKVLSSSSGGIEGFLEKVGEKSLSFLDPDWDGQRFSAALSLEQRTEWEALFREFEEKGWIEKVNWVLDRTSVTLVGNCLPQDPRAMSRVLKVLKRLGVPFLGVKSSAHSITAWVASDEAHRVQREFHTEFLD
jgi:aspartate kinase